MEESNYKKNPAATQHHEGKVYESHTIPPAPEKVSWMQMMRNMRVRRTVSHLMRKNHVEYVGGVGNGIWHERKVRRHKHMGRQKIGGTGSESDIHHRGTDKKCKKPYERLLLRQLDERSCP